MREGEGIAIKFSDQINRRGVVVSHAQKKFRSQLREELLQINRET